VWVRSGLGERIAESFIERVAPTVAMIPERLWHDPNAAEYGRAVAAIDLVPGGAVRIRFY
jgi:hypothetical protein